MNSCNGEKIIHVHIITFPNNITQQNNLFPKSFILTVSYEEKLCPNVKYKKQKLIGVNLTNSNTFFPACPSSQVLHVYKTGTTCVCNVSENSLRVHTIKWCTSQQTQSPHSSYTYSKLINSSCITRYSSCVK